MILQTVVHISFVNLVVLMKNVVKQSMIYGALIGVISALVALCGYLFDALGSPVFSVVSILVSIALYTFMVKHYRDTHNEGYIALKDVVILVMLVVTFATFVSSSINIAHLKLNDAYMQSTINTAVEAAEKMGEMVNFSGAQLDDIVNAAVDGIKNQGIFDIVSGSIFAGLFGGILGLILGAIFKKERPVFDNDSIEE